MRMSTTSDTYKLNIVINKNQKLVHNKVALESSSPRTAT